mmetsp:Transcript_47084/g.82863  ORF Transcript_47084/g.82863 Transcript_47084/m.82863 type:complete len:384 (-) Transcript_47084:212-1363(-)
MSGEGGWEVMLAGKWTPYGDAEARMLDDAMKSGKHSFEYDMRGHHYVVDLDSMQQVNPSTGKTRAVRCQTMEGVGAEEDEEEEPEIKEEPEEAGGEDADEEEVKEEEEEDEKEAEATKPAGPPAKKRKLYHCPIPVTDFLRDAEPRNFRFQAAPRRFKNGTYGWHLYRVRKTKSGPLAGIITNTTGIMKVVGSASLNAKKFLKAAPIKNMCLRGTPLEFSTGSFGWSMYKKGRLLCDGKMVTCQIYLNAVVRGSKPAKPAAPAADPVAAKLDATAVKKEVEELGPTSEGEKDDLKKIAGIGPCTEARLNKVGIKTFSQVSKMTPEIREKVMKTIEHFPKDPEASKDMVADAKTLATGRTPVRSRSFVGDEIDDKAEAHPEDAD